MKAGHQKVILLLGVALVGLGLMLIALGDREEQEAMAVVANDLRALHDQALPCLRAVEHAPTPDRFAREVRRCIEAKYQGSYALQIGIELPAAGPRLKQLTGAESSLPADVVQACVNRLTTDFKPSPLGQESWHGKMYEVYLIELARDGAGTTRAWKSSRCGIPHPPSVDRQPMRPVDDDHAQALLACDALMADDAGATRPFVMGLTIRDPVSMKDTGQCEAIGDWLPSAYSRCVCEAYLAAKRLAFNDQPQGTISLEVKMPDGRTVVSSQANKPSAPEPRRWWFLRQADTNPDPYLAMGMGDADIPIALSVP